jgi:hypothetical protein
MRELWILVISLLIGTAIAPGPGTAAGWAVFEAQGIAALISVVVEHVVRFVHSFFKLYDIELTAEEENTHLKQITGSGLVLSISAAMYFLGSIGSRVGAKVLKALEGYLPEELLGLLAKLRRWLAGKASKRARIAGTEHDIEIGITTKGSYVSVCSGAELCVILDKAADEIGPVKVSDDLRLLSAEAKAHPERQAEVGLKVKQLVEENRAQIKLQAPELEAKFPPKGEKPPPEPNPAKPPEKPPEAPPEEPPKPGKIPRPDLPPFDGTTRGVLITNEGKTIPFESGPPDPKYAKYPSAKHAEGKAAIWIRENKSSGGVFYHNNPKGTCASCRSNLPTLLPENGKLEVVPPENARAPDRFWDDKPRLYTGSARQPVLPGP